ncbi:MAG: hypothetical protein ACI9MR_001097 [Myxococcota bacterium]
MRYIPLTAVKSTATKLTAAAAMCALVATSVAAESSTGNVSPSLHQHSIGVELGFFADTIAGVDVFAISQDVHASIALSDSLAFKATLPFATALVSVAGTSESKFAFGNPQVGVSFLLNRAQYSEVTIEPSLTIPLASISDDDAFDAALSTVAYAGALGIRGLREAWLYAPETFALVVPLRAAHASGALRIGTDLTAALLIPTSDSDVRDPEMMAQLDLRVGGQFGQVQVGLGLATVANLGGDDEVQFQTSIDPYVQLHLAAATLEMRMVINLDAPLGTSFSDENTLWGFLVGADFPLP